MVRSQNPTLHRRAEQAGILFAATSAPFGFQRTLMPRDLVDQALISGLSASANHALVSLVQDSIHAAALLFTRQSARHRVDDRRWSRASIAADLAAIGIGVGVQRAFRQHTREPLPRSGLRTGGFWLATGGVAGAAVGVLQEAAVQGGWKPRRTIGVVAPAAAAVAATNAWLVRRRSQLDEKKPDETTPSLVKSLGAGLGVTVAAAALGAAERKLADLVSRSAARVFPGTDAMWRPLGHAVALTGAAFAGRALAVRVLHRIEHAQESAEAAYDIPPENPLVSGSPESLVPFGTLSRAGRRYVWMVNSRRTIEEVMGEPAIASPVRAYVGLESAPTEQERVDLAMRELERVGAFEREWLMIASPTGTGYVNYAAVSILEMLTRGNCATVAMQYSARPSPLSLDRVGEGRLHARLLCAAIRDRVAACPDDARPKVVLFGESLGAWTSQDGFVDEGTRGLVDAGIDHAIWIGTPHFSKWKERVLYDDRPDVDRDVVGVFNDIGEWRALDPARREKLRYVMITHYDDGVGLFGPELSIQAPDWLRDPQTRHASVPKGMRWKPTTTFFQVLVDMKNAANVVPGVFDAKGHDYRADLLPFFHAVLGLEATAEQLDAVEQHLVERELLRSQWAKGHGTADTSLSATVLERLVQDARTSESDGGRQLLERVRAIVREEFGVSGAVVGSDS
jgi:uncharacterized membrane protein